VDEWRYSSVYSLLRRQMEETGQFTPQKRGSTLLTEQVAGWASELV